MKKRNKSKKATLPELRQQALNKMKVTKEVYYVIKTEDEKKQVVSNNELYHLTKDGCSFQFVWEPTEEQIRKHV